MNEFFELPDGTVVGTGCLTPPNKLTMFLSYVSAGPMLSRQQLIDMAPRQAIGVNSFDASFIKNQKSHGSCNGFAGATALTKARIRRGLERLDLSGAYLYSLINGGRDRGSMLEDGMRVMQERGVASESTVDWDQIYPSQYNKSKADLEAADNRAFECFAIFDELELFSALASGFDVVVAVHADNGFMKMDSHGVAQGGQGGGNHAVGADGYWYNEATKEFVADGVNSWGTTYGIQGRMGMTWNRHFRPTVRNHQFYGIRSTLDSKDGRNPKGA